MTWGDGVPVVKWADESGKPFAVDCTFQPSKGGMWNEVPDASYLEKVS